MATSSTKLRPGNTQTEQLKATLKPLAEADTLAPWAYTSEAFYEVEVREIFMKEWLSVGRADEIENPGDYFCADIADEPIVVLRDPEGVVRAFLRTCRHRGACVVEGRGNARFFRCPFHGWTYNFRGHLIAARQMENTHDFDRGDWPLLALRVEIWEGFIFINFDQDAAPLAPRLVELSKKIRGYRLSELRAAKPMPFWNECNWKLSAEQAMDMYHVPDTHFMPKAGQRVAKTFGEEEPNGHWTVSYSPLEREHPFITGTNQNQTAFPAIEGLSEFELTTFNLFLIYPSTVIGLLPQGAMTFTIYPQGVGRTNVTLNLYFTEAGFQIDNFEQHLRDAQDGFIVTNNQDMHSAKLTHHGMHSKLLSPGRFASLERTTWELQRYVIRKTCEL